MVAERPRQLLVSPLGQRPDVLTSASKKIAIKFAARSRRVADFAWILSLGAVRLFASA
jgi:hypothetical protein